MKIEQNNYRQFSFLLFILFALSIALVYILSKIVSIYEVQVPFFISLPSILGIYSVMFYLFDNYLWKLSIFKKIKIINSENLNGQWQGYIKSSYDSMQSKIVAELKIRQTATKIKIYGKFNNSKSVSINENFAFSEIDNSVALFYFYKNEPSYDAVETMAMHEGSVKLILDREKNILTGSYYSGRDRNNHGTIFVERSENK